MAWRKRRDRKCDWNLGPLAKNTQRDREIERNEAFNLVAARAGHDKNSAGRRSRLYGQIGFEERAVDGEIADELDPFARHSPFGELLGIAPVDGEGAVE